MADDTNEPNWSHLPGDPARFFGLSPPIDRRELKKRYAQFIRRFKPEQFPNEFQRIRAAYEQLDLALRYGTSTIDNGEFDFARSTPTTVNRQPPTAPSANTLLARLESESADDVYAEIGGKARKTAADFLALAFLSDVVESESDLPFIRWVFAGLRENSKDPALQQVVFHFLSSEVEVAFLPQILKLAAEHVPERYFYPLTESLWKKLLNRRGFDCFKETLADCQSMQPGLQIESRIAFIIQIMRIAIWEANRDWIEESFAYIEGNFQYIPRHLDFDVDLLLALQAFVNSREEFLAKHPLRARFDAALRSHFTSDQIESDKQIIALQLDLLENVDSLRDSFPDVDDRPAVTFFELWHWISRDVAARNYEDLAPAPPDDLWRSKTWGLLERADYLAGSTVLGLLWTAGNLGFLLLTSLGTLAAMASIVGICVLVSSLRVLPRDYEHGALAVYMVITLAGGIFAGIWLRKQIREYWSDEYNRRMGWRLYRRHWQREVFGLLTLSRIDIPTLLQYVALGNSSQASNWIWLSNFMQRDIALASYSIAQRFEA